MWIVERTKVERFQQTSVMSRAVVWQKDVFRVFVCLTATTGVASTTAAAVAAAATSCLSDRGTHFGKKLPVFLAKRLFSASRFEPQL